MSRLVFSDFAPPVARRGSSWLDSAACRGADPELFFPVGVTGPAAADIRAAKAICWLCPAREPCLAYAVATGQDAGIWGGYDEGELRGMRQRQQPVRGTAGTANGMWP